MILGIVPVSLMETIGFMYTYKYSQTKDWKHITLAFVGYSGLIFALWYFFIQNPRLNLNKFNASLQISAILIGSLISALVFKQGFDHPVQYMGILLGIMAIVCIHYKPTGALSRSS